MLALLLITAGFIIVIIIAAYKKDNTNIRENWVYPFAISGIVSGINVSLRLTLLRLTNWEVRTTFTNQYISMIGKVTLFVFLNESLIILMAY